MMDGNLRDLSGLIRNVKDVHPHAAQNLNASRDFLPLSDVLCAYETVRKLSLNSNPRVVTYNASSGIGRSIKSILDDRLRAPGLDVEIAIDSSRLRPSEIAKAVGNAEKLRTATLRKPMLTWMEGSCRCSKSPGAWRHVLFLRVFEIARVIDNSHVFEDKLVIELALCFHTNHNSPPV
jgi:hypothetical protein